MSSPIDRYIVVPSIPYICRELVRYLSNHPLFINPLVVHPITNEKIKVAYYRNEDGIISQQRALVCSIFPFSGGGNSSIPSPASYSVSATFEPYDLGSKGTDKAIYNVIIKFDYNEPAIQTSERDTIYAPNQAITDPGQYLLIDGGNEPVRYFIHSPYEILGQTLELARLAISDTEYKACFPLNIKSMEVVYANLPQGRWEESTKVVFHSGWVLVRIVANVSRGWRDKFAVPVKDIVVDASPPTPDPTGNIIIKDVLDDPFIEEN